MADKGSDDRRGATPMGWWDRVIDEMEARAAEYRADGWQALSLHPGDVTAIDGDASDGTDEFGLDVLIPDDEFEELQSVLEPADVDRYDVYRTTFGSYVVGLVAVTATDRELVVLFPVYYATGDESVEALFDRAVPAGQLPVWLRVLSGDRIELTLEDPELLAPRAADDGDTAAGDASDAEPADSGQ